MVLSVPVLKASIKTVLDDLEAASKAEGADPNDVKDLFAEKLATAVINHIQAYGVPIGTCPSGGGLLVGGQIT